MLLHPDSALSIFHPLISKRNPRPEARAERKEAGAVGLAVEHQAPPQLATTGQSAHPFPLGHSWACPVEIEGEVHQGDWFPFLTQCSFPWEWPFSGWIVVLGTSQETSASPDLSNEVANLFCFVESTLAWVCFLRTPTQLVLTLQSYCTANLCWGRVHVTEVNSFAPGIRVILFWFYASVCLFKLCWLLELDLITCAKSWGVSASCCFSLSGHQPIFFSVLIPPLRCNFMAREIKMLFWPGHLSGH